MKPLSALAISMRDDWNRRVQADYRFWITNEISSGSSGGNFVWEEGEKDFSQIVAGLDITDFSVALEVGCGVGRMLPAAATRFKTVIGVDVSPMVIAKAQELLGQRKGIRVEANSGFDLSQLATGSIDFAWSFAALPHMPTRVFAAYLCELKRVLSSNGCARLQLFLGQQESPAEGDTLRLRAYQETYLRKAIELSGLEVISITPTELPLQELLDELSLRPVIVTIRQTQKLGGESDELAQALLPDGGESTVTEISCTEFEAWIALHYADRLYQDGEYERARATLEYVSMYCRTAQLDIKDTLNRIASVSATRDTGMQMASNLGNNQLYLANLEVIKSRFPTIYQGLLAQSAQSNCNLEIKPSAEGPVLWLDRTCLDHAEKPVLAADQWVKRAMNDARFNSSSYIICIGFGCGYHLESLLAHSNRKVACIEPNLAVLKKALSVRDLRTVLEKLESLSISADGVSTDKNSIAADVDAEILVRPQSIAFDNETTQGVLSKLYAKRGLTQLRPKIAVLGPLQGGTLPIGHYCTSALQRLGQRVRGVDMSGFNSAYENFGALVNNDMRLGLVRQTYIETLSSALLEGFAEKPIDILICMAQAPISPRALTELRRQGVITVLWFVEDYLRFTYWRETAKYYDFVFTIQRGECLEAMKAAGAGEVHYLPTACDPYVHAPAVLTAEEKKRWGAPLSFVGAGYHNRREMFSSLAHYPFKIWGTEWPGCKPFDKLVQEAGRRLTPEEYTKIFNSTEVNINLHSSNERDGVDPTGDFLNPRTFELAACGAFQLVDERALLGESFEDGKEIVTFKTLADLREKIDYYLEHPEERERITLAGQARARRDHTYDARMEQMLSVVYTSAYQRLRQRSESNPWADMIKRAEFDPELKERCERAKARGEEPILDGLIADIATGKGQLTDAEQKLLFLFHVRKQIVRMEREGAGVRN